MIQFFRASLILTTLAVLISMAGRAEAFPVTITFLEDSSEWLVGLTAEGTLAVEMPAGAGGAKSRPAPPPKFQVQPPPRRQWEAALRTTGANAGSSMSGSPVSSVSAGGGVAAADLAPTDNLPQSPAGSYLRTSDWLLIPAHVPDGTFRPPRHVVSL